MSEENVRATTTVRASAEAVFTVLRDPSRHAAIDGTGWVTAAVDDQAITRRGQVFRMAMYHRDHPDGSYETANEVLAFVESRALSWRTGYVDEKTGELKFGGWSWRYDLEPVGPCETEVTLTYDWSAVGPGPREYLAFPPFPPDHLDDSLRHLSEMLVEGMVIIAGHFRVDASRRHEYVEAFGDLVQRARAAPGCLDIAITADPVDPERVNNFERWESDEALTAFRAVADPPDLDVALHDGEMSKFRISRETGPFE